jgi:hypothetical protein
MPARLGRPAGLFDALTALALFVNFFGHATLALKQSDDPRFVLGSMLPDLVSMAGVRIAQAHDPVLAAGIALHHETDARFHSAAPFTELCHAANEQLQAAGVGRATARAVGHVGTELLLDGLLSFNEQASAAYKHTLEHSVREPMHDALSLRGEATTADLQTLLARLHRAPLPEGYRDPSFVLDRLQTILARRPRLAFQPTDLAPTLTWLTATKAHLEHHGTAWIDTLL